MWVVELRREEGRGGLEDLVGSSAFSFFNLLLSAVSSVVLPGLAPPSTSARRTHWRNDSREVIPDFPAIERIASYSLDGRPETPGLSVPRAHAALSGYFEGRAMRVILPRKDLSRLSGAVQVASFTASDRTVGPVGGHISVGHRRYEPDTG